MRPDRPEPLGDAIVLTPDDIDDRQRQESLRGLLQRRVEDLVHLVPEDDRRHGGGGDPQERQQDAERQRQPGLKAARQRHGAPRR